MLHGVRDDAVFALLGDDFVETNDLIVQQPGVFFKLHLVDEYVINFLYLHLGKHPFDAALDSIAERLSGRGIKINVDLFGFPFLFMRVIRCAIAIVLLRQCKLAQYFVDIMVYFIVQLVADAFGDDQRNLVSAGTDQCLGMLFINRYAICFRHQP